MKHQPRVIAIAAVTIDGKIALNKTHLPTWTSPEDKRSLHTLLDKSDAVVVGRTTYETAKKPLSKRNCIVLTSSVSETKRVNKKLLFCNPERVSLLDILKRYKQVALLGGTQTYTYFLKHDLLDEIFLTIEPLVFGKGLNLFEDGPFSPPVFHLASIKKLNKKGSLLLHYQKS